MIRDKQTTSSGGRRQRRQLVATDLQGLQRPQALLPPVALLGGGAHRPWRQLCKSFDFVLQRR